MQPPPPHPIPSPPPSGRDVFEILVREHADMLTCYLRSLVADPGAVDDLFQEAMLVAWRRLGDYDRGRPFGPWLRGIAGMLVLEYRRKVGRGVMCCEPEVLEALEENYAAMARTPGDSFRERVQRLRVCLSKLPDRLRETVEFAYGRGLLLRQIAEATGATEEAVKKRIQRAREALVQCLGGDADMSEGGGRAAVGGNVGDAGFVGGER